MCIAEGREFIARSVVDEQSPVWWSTWLQAADGEPNLPALHSAPVSRNARPIYYGDALIFTEKVFVVVSPVTFVTVTLTSIRPLPSLLSLCSAGRERTT